MSMTLTREQIESWRECFSQHSESGEFDALCNMALAWLEVQPRPTHKHIKTGGIYQMIGIGAVQSERPLTDMQPVVIYRSMKNGSLWARAEDEFYDEKRFSSLPEPK